MDRVVKNVYDGLGNLKEIVAMDQNGDDNSSDDESTKYFREDLVDASLVTREVYPDSTGGEDYVTMSYLLNGQVSQRKDQRGVTLGYTYSMQVAGRPLALESATVPVGIGVDTAAPFSAMLFAIPGIPTAKEGEMRGPATENDRAGRKFCTGKGWLSLRFTAQLVLPDFSQKSWLLESVQMQG